MIRRPPRSTQSRSSAASDVYKRQVLPAAGAAEVEEVDAGDVFVEQALDVPAQVALREDRRWDVECAFEAQPLGDLGVDLLDAAQPELIEHGLLGGRRRVRDVGVDERFVSHVGSSLLSRQGWEALRRSAAPQAVVVEDRVDDAREARLVLDAPRRRAVPEVDEIAAHEADLADEVVVPDV